MKFTGDFETATWLEDESFVWAWAVCEIGSENLKFGNSIETFFEFCEAEKNPEIYFKEFEKLRAVWLAGNDKAKLYSIFYSIISRLSAEKEQLPSVLSKTVSYIHENINNPNLSNTLLAEKAKISEVYFRKIFNESFGTTPKQYILSLRIEEAKRLLDEGISSVSAISDACGFSSVYHFSRAFKSATGMTPTEYGRQN
jgi:AraC-like DNA-binding protein